MVLYVTKRLNPGYNLINYGPLPTLSTDSWNLYPSGVGGSSGPGTASPGAAGEAPASAWKKGYQFDVPSTFFVSGTFPYGTSDIWYTQVKNEVFEVRQDVNPGWMRIGLDIPTNQNQQTLQQSVAGGVDQDFGWKRGSFYAVHIPNIHYGYGYGNDTNLPVYTKVAFRYAEQQVEVVSDPNLVYDIINGAVPAHLVEMPVVNTPGAVTQALQQTWGFDGVPVPRRNTPRGIALSAIQAALSTRTGGAS